MATTTHPRASLLGIPLEIRQQILSIYLKTSQCRSSLAKGHTIRAWSENFLIDGENPMVLRQVCRQLRAELQGLMPALTPLHIDFDTKKRADIAFRGLSPWYRETVQHVKFSTSTKSLVLIKAALERLPSLKTLEVSVQSPIRNSFFLAGLASKTLDHQKKLEALERLDGIKTRARSLMKQYRAALPSSQLRIVIRYVFEYTSFSWVNHWDLGRDPELQHVVSFIADSLKLLRLIAAGCRICR
jgi:hypothetical protein